MEKVFLCFIVYVYVFIYVGNTCDIVTGSCLVCDVNKELGNDDPPTMSILDITMKNKFSMYWNRSYKACLFLITMLPIQSIILHM